MKKLLGITAAVLLASTQANAATLNITYTYGSEAWNTGGFPPTSTIVTSSKEMPAGGPVTATPGPTELVSGTGTIDTVTGEITLDAIDWQLTIASGSTGYYDWSQTLNGSFSGSTYTQTGWTVNSGSLACADVASSGCVGGGGVGAASTPETVDLDATIAFSSLTVGGVGTFESVVEVFAGGPVETTLIEMTIVSAAVPVPAAAWLFGSGLLGLAGVARKRRA